MARKQVGRKRYIVELSKEEKEQLVELTRKGRPSARKVRRANILLQADAGKMDAEIVANLHTSRSTVERIRKKLVEGGLDFALNERPRCGRSRLLDGKGEACLVALACSDPPEGRKSWTMQLLADRLMELEVVERISDETVRLRLKKNDLKPWQRKQWCIPKVDGEFVWRMEDILDLYAAPRDPRYPQVCFDETPYQLIGETRQPLPRQPGQPERFDYEYRRNGTRNLFIFFQPLAGWRHVKVTERRTKQDYAQCMKDLVDVHFPDAEQIRVVQDNLNTHTPASLYETFPPAEARRILSRLEFHHTPNHASWLNMVEVEISVLMNQCLDRRIPDEETLKSETAAWEARRNEQKATVNWQFDNARARDKLRRLYPS